MRNRAGLSKLIANTTPEQARENLEKKFGVKLDMTKPLTQEQMYTDILLFTLEIMAKGLEDDSIGSIGSIEDPS